MFGPSVEGDDDEETQDAAYTDDSASMPDPPITTTAEGETVDTDSGEITPTEDFIPEKKEPKKPGKQASFMED
jgi:hypothetical protein